MRFILNADETNFVETLQNKKQTRTHALVQTKTLLYKLYRYTLYRFQTVSLQTRLIQHIPQIINKLIPTKAITRNS